MQVSCGWAVGTFSMPTTRSLPPQPRSKVVARSAHVLQHGGGHRSWNGSLTANKTVCDITDKLVEILMRRSDFSGVPPPCGWLPYKHGCGCGIITVVVAKIGAGNRINATCVDVTFVSISGSDLCTCENTMAKASGAKLSVVDATAAVAAGTAQRPVLLLRQGNRTLRSSLAFDTVEEKTEDEESLARRKQRALVGVVEQHQEELSGHRLRRPRTEVRRFRAMVKRGETIEVAMDGFPHGAEDFCKHVVQCTANYHLFLHPCRGEA